KGLSTDGKLHLARGEQLDVVGLTKRLGGGRRGYPSVSRIASDPWLRGIVKCNAAATGFRDLLDECHRLNGLPNAPLSRIDLRRYPQYRDFPFEGTALYLERHRELAEEGGLDPGELAPLRAALGQLTDYFGHPDPYLAVLVADGDRVGPALDEIAS